MKQKVISYLVCVCHWKNGDSCKIVESKTKFSNLDDALEFYYANVGNLFINHLQYSIHLYKVTKTSSVFYTVLKSEFSNI